MENETGRQGNEGKRELERVKHAERNERDKPTTKLTLYENLDSLIHKLIKVFS